MNGVVSRVHALWSLTAWIAKIDNANANTAIVEPVYYHTGLMHGPPKIDLLKLKNSCHI